MLPGRVELNSADVASAAPDFSAGEIFTIKGTITTMNHPTNLKKGQTGIVIEVVVYLVGLMNTFTQW